MPETKVALIVDKSEPYLSFQKRLTLRRWSVKSETAEALDGLDAPVTPSLFGDELCYQIRLDKPDDVKKFNEAFAKLGADGLRDKFPHGLIILASVPRTSTAKLEKSMKEAGAVVSIPPGKKDNESVSDKILAGLFISRSLKEMLTEFVGEDYEELLPIVVDLTKMSEAEQRRLTEEDLLLRLPQDKGNIPPWDIEKYMMNGNLVKMIQLSRRVSANKSGIIFPLAVIRSKMDLCYRILALLKTDNRLSDNDIAEALGETSSKVFAARKYTIGKHSLVAFEKALVIMDEVERNVKGASAAPSATLFESALVRVALVFKEDK